MRKNIKSCEPRRCSRLWFHFSKDSPSMFQSHEAHGFPSFFVQESDEEDDEKVEKRLGISVGFFRHGTSPNWHFFFCVANHGWRNQKSNVAIEHSEGWWICQGWWNRFPRGFHWAFTDSRKMWSWWLDPLMDHKLFTRKNRTTPSFFPQLAVSGLNFSIFQPPGETEARSSCCGGGQAQRTAGILRWSEAETPVMTCWSRLHLPWGPWTPATGAGEGDALRFGFQQDVTCRKFKASLKLVQSLCFN